MADDEREFEHESLQNKRSIIAYLGALQNGFKNGTLTISDPEGTIDLKPNGLVRFQVRAGKKHHRIRLTLKMEWRTDSAENGRAWPLTVRSEDDEA